MSPAPSLPAASICEQARRSRDARFDGLFFVAVSSTGIYCRPVCPAPSAKRENVRYFANAAAAEVAGYRPCLRCRPELAPGSDEGQRGNRAVARALKLIEAGALAEQSLDALATQVGVGARQLRRLFVEHVGAPPISVHTTRRLLFAKQLLTETALPVTEVALASGFRSLRRFNAAFAQANRIAPRELRRHPRAMNPRPAAADAALEYGGLPPILAASAIHAVPGGALASTGVAKSPGACRGGSFPRKSSGKKPDANDDVYALAA